MNLLYFAPVFARSYAQRPHFTVEHWLELGAESVLWVEPYPVRLPRLSDVFRPRGIYDQSTALDPQIRVLRVPALPIEPLPGGSWLNRRLLWSAAWRQMTDFSAGGSLVIGIGRPSALALHALRNLPDSAAFYEAMDNFPEFHTGLSRLSMRRHEDAIASEVDLVLTSSTFLAEKFFQRGLRVEKMLNACTPDTLPIRKPNCAARPILGFVGCLGDWIDWLLLLRLADQLSEVDIELVGPLAARPPESLPSNIRVLPPCKQHEVGLHLKRFSAGLIPFRLTSLTAGMDPIKFYEYRAAGLPVLSTAFGQMSYRGADDGVYFLDRQEDLRPVVQGALDEPFDLRAIEQFRRANDWRYRFRQADPFRCLLPKRAMRPAA
jgi:hypothetical protein